MPIWRAWVGAILLLFSGNHHRQLFYHFSGHIIRSFIWYLPFFQNDGAGDGPEFPFQLIFFNNYVKDKSGDIFHLF
tara:strand:- start:6103 stop:6330 length:228 start_codon:yes stop_codon:yes gene_type:complete